MLRYQVMDEEVRIMVAEAYERTVALMEQHRDNVKKVAELLLKVNWQTNLCVDLDERQKDRITHKSSLIYFYVCLCFLGGNHQSHGCGTADWRPQVLCGPRVRRVLSACE